MAKKLVLVNPINPRRVGLTVNPSSRFQPIGLGIIAALTPRDWKVEIVDENFAPFEFRDADLVGLTAFTANVTRAYEISSLYREKGVPTVLGGIHASMMPEEALQYADSIVVGEAESVWSEVISDFESGKLQEVYKGDLLDLQNMPQPRRDLFHPGYMFGSVQTSRGCPMNCEFCSVTAFNGYVYRKRPVENVLDELESIPQKRVFFDDNIIGFGKQDEERAIALFKGMIERGIKKEWFCQASINFAGNDEVLEYAAKSGCRMVFLGLEAESTSALEDVNKKLNLRVGVSSYDDAFRRINQHGIAVLGAFIYGMDSDTPEKLRARTDYILKSGIDVMQVTYLTPLLGTRLFNKLKDEQRLRYTNFPSDWVHYDMTEVTHTPQSMTPTELAEAMDECTRRLYSSGTIRKKFFKTWRSTKSFTTAMWAYTSNMNYRKVA
ncbi:B12-binding domain-containing radical SAM protein, partial [Candidatus Bathyarchaeota archaeon]|nr:B12-binding domain-containing radical SAM protein [Candidatus Bathyarchaeota archaeon]